MDYLFCYEGSSNGLQKKLSVYNKYSGALFQSIPVSSEIIGMAINEPPNELLLIMNNGSESDFKLYDFPSNSITDLDFIPSINPEAALLSESKYPYHVFVAHQSGIQFYNNLEASGSGYPISGVLKMKYDPLNNVLYVLTTNALHILNSNATAELNSIPVPAGSVDFLLVYNK
jgi:hypothetical protein